MAKNDSFKLNVDDVVEWKKDTELQWVNKSQLIGRISMRFDYNVVTKMYRVNIYDMSHVRTEYLGPNVNDAVATWNRKVH